MTPYDALDAATAIVQSARQMNYERAMLYLCGFLLGLMILRILIDVLRPSVSRETRTIEGDHTLVLKPGQRIVILREATNAG